MRIACSRCHKAGKWCNEAYAWQLSPYLNHLVACRDRFNHAQTQGANQEELDTRWEMVLEAMAWWKNRLTGWRKNNRDSVEAVKMTEANAAAAEHDRRYPIVPRIDTAALATQAINELAGVRVAVENVAAGMSGRAPAPRPSGLVDPVRFSPRLASPRLASGQGSRQGSAEFQHVDDFAAAPPGSRRRSSRLQAELDRDEGEFVRDNGSVPPSSQAALMTGAGAGSRPPSRQPSTPPQDVPMGGTGGSRPVSRRGTVLPDRPAGGAGADTLRRSRRQRGDDPDAHPAAPETPSRRPTTTAPATTPGSAGTPSRRSKAPLVLTEPKTRSGKERLKSIEEGRE